MRTTVNESLLSNAANISRSFRNEMKKTRKTNVLENKAATTVLHRKGMQCFSQACEIGGPARPQLAHIPLPRQEAMSLSLCTRIGSKLDIALFEIRLVPELSLEDICILDVAEMPNCGSDLPRTLVYE